MKTTSSNRASGLVRSLVSLVSSRVRPRPLALPAILAALLLTAACSSSPAPKAISSSTRESALRPVALHTTSHTTAAMASTSPANSVAASVGADDASTATPPELIRYRSRDYGVSFHYPWQYAFVSARTLASEGSALHPKQDGYENQVALAGVEIPQGFYPDTDFERGYFLLSLNQNLSQQQCQALVVPGLVAEKDNKKASGNSEAQPATRTINGTQFYWNESESGGRGSAVKQRRYTSFANGTCYEVEMGVNTHNQDGLAREINPDRVLARLESILQTVKILPAMQDTETATETSSVAPVEAPQE